MDNTIPLQRTLREEVPFDNLIIKRRINVAKYLSDHLPNDVSKLISKYDYYLEGKYSSFVCNSTISCVCALSAGLPGGIVTGLYNGTIAIWNSQTGICEIIL